MCDFCLRNHLVFMENESCFAMSGENIISHGHMIVMTKQHTQSYFDLSYQELEDMNQLAKNVRSYLDEVLNPDGYNIVVSVGKWAGQSKPHVAMHIIPRYAGDVPATELKDGLLHFKKNYDKKEEANG